MEESDNCSEHSDLESCDSPWDCLHSPEYYRRWDRSSSKIENLDILIEDLSLVSKKLLEAKDGIQTIRKGERRKHRMDGAVIDEVQSWFIRLDRSMKLRNRFLRPKFPMNLLQSKQQRNKVVLELTENFLELKSEAEAFIGAITQIPQPFRRIELQPYDLTVREEFIMLRIREFVEDEFGEPFIFIPPLYDLTENKTRMLQEFHNKLGDEWGDTGDTFDVVIWLEVASSPMSKIQNDLAERLDLSFVGSETSFEKRAIILHSSLSRFRFLMILDQVESVLNLEELGIPRPPSHGSSSHGSPSHRSMWSKIIVASPSLDVCESMGVENWSHWYDSTLKSYLSEPSVHTWEGHSANSTADELLIGDDAPHGEET